jgi:hypothetical protein
VELTPGETRVFPPGYEPLAGDPVGNLTRAFELGAREHLMVAAGLVPPGRREEATGVLVGLLSRPPSPATITVMGALRLLTGERFANRPDAWIEWWRARNAPSGG